MKLSQSQLAVLKTLERAAFQPPRTHAGYVAGVSTTVDSLVRRGLVEWSEQGYRLTDSGRELCARVQVEKEPGVVDWFTIAEGVVDMISAAK